MSGFLVQAGAMVTCPHGAPVQLVPTQPRVLAGGAPVLVLASPGVVAGCPFLPTPCLTCQMTVGTARVLVAGQPAITQGSVGVCAPGGPPIVLLTQTRVQGM